MSGVALFAKLSLGVEEHRRVLAACERMQSSAPFGIYCWSIVTARREETDGEVWRAQVRAALGGWDGLACAEHLVAVGLWEATADGWRVVRYADHNETRAEIEARRARDRSRKSSDRIPRGARSDSEGTPLGIPVSDSLSGSGSDSEPEYGSGHRARAVVPQDSATALQPPDVAEPGGLNPGAAARGPLSGGPTPGGPPTPPPADIPLTTELIDACRMAATPMPSRVHVVACLAHARERGHTSHDWGAYFQRWMCRQREFDKRASRDGPRRPSEDPPSEGELTAIRRKRKAIADEVLAELRAKQQAKESA